MKITHLTHLTAAFSPFRPSSKTPRLLLSLIPPSAQGLKISVTQLPQNTTLPSTLEVGFKDGEVMKWSFTDAAKEEGVGAEQLRLKDVVEQVERHTRKLRRAEELSG